MAEDYPVTNAFTGEVNWVEIDVGEAAGTSTTTSTPTSSCALRWRASSAGPSTEGEACLSGGLEPPTSLPL